MSKKILISTFVSVVLAVNALAGVQIEPLWTLDLQTYLESAPTLADLNGDGLSEVIVLGREEIIAVDGSGKELWRRHSNARYMSYAAVLMREGLSPLIYAADSLGTLTCVDAQGNPVWQVKLKGGTIWSAPVVCDLAGDDAADVVQTDESGTVSAYCALTGAVKWQASVQGKPVSPAVGDIDGDGKPEVAVCTHEGMLVVLGGDGAVLWEQKIGGISETWGTSAPIIVTGADGRAQVVAASSEGVIQSYDKAGQLLWSRNGRGPVASGLSAGDIDRDGQVDLFVITQLGVVFRFDEEGRVVWDIDMQGRTLAGGAVVDVDGAGDLEFALCTQAGRMLILDSQGQTQFEHQFGSRTINVTPAFGPLTGSGQQVVVTGGESGNLLCLTTPAPGSAERQWSQYRGDAQMTGAWRAGQAGGAAAAAMVPRGMTSDAIYTGEPVCFDIVNPEQQTLVATSTCIRPDGARQTAMTRVLGPEGVLNMPIDVLAPGLYRFSWTLNAASGSALLMSGERELFLQPFSNDRALALRALAKLNETASEVETKLPLASKSLRREAVALDAAAREVMPLQDASAVDGSEIATEKTAAVTRAALRALGLVDAVRLAAAQGDGTSLLVFEGAMWENRGVDRALPAQVASPLKITRDCVAGEHDATSLKLFNVTDRELQVRVIVEAPAHGPLIKAHRSVATVTARGDLAWDALPELDESMVVSVPSFETRELWLDTDLTMTGPGTHACKVRLQALNGSSVVVAASNPQSIAPQESVVEITYSMHDFRMAPAESFRLCCWASIKDWSTDPEVDDLLAHGNNVFVAPGATAVYDGEQLHFDFTALDVVLKRLQGKGAFLLLGGTPAIKAAPDSPEYAAAIKAMVDALVPRLEAAGFSKSDFAMYPVDEPGIHGWDPVNRLISFCKAVKAADPGVQGYVDGGGEIPMFEAMAPYVDIWCPGHYQLPDGTAPSEYLRKSDKTLWTYNCYYSYCRPVGPNIKDANVVAEFRNAALYGLRYGVTGIGFWCYNIGDDMWQRVALGYPLVYAGNTKPVTSRRWEAVREGMEDCRIALALRARLEDASVSEDAKARIRHLLEVSLPQMIDLSYKENNQGLGRDALDRTNNDESVEKFRGELMDCAKALQ